MVQIILIAIWLLGWIILKLYIPHGSDNTLLSRKMMSASSSIFISHMVQIILKTHRQAGNMPPLLYIPHGSDNTVTISARNFAKQSFISHMVQIILNRNLDIEK